MKTYVKVETYIVLALIRVFKVPIADLQHGFHAAMCYRTAVVMMTALADATR